MSPEPVAETWRVHPGVGKNESIANPDGTVSWIDVVVAPDSSVGTESVKTWSYLSSATAGLTIACADAAAVTTSPAALASTSTPIRVLQDMSLLTSR